MSALTPKMSKIPKPPLPPESGLTRWPPGAIWRLSDTYLGSFFCLVLLMLDKYYGHGKEEKDKCVTYMTANGD